MIQNRTFATLHGPNFTSILMSARKTLARLSTYFGEAETSWNHGQTQESGISVDDAGIVGKSEVSLDMQKMRPS